MLSERLLTSRVLPTANSPAVHSNTTCHFQKLPHIWLPHLSRVSVSMSRLVFSPATDHELEYNVVRGGHSDAVIALYSCSGGVVRGRHHRTHSDCWASAQCISLHVAMTPLACIELCQLSSGRIGSQAGPSGDQDYRVFSASTDNTVGSVM